MRSRRTRGTAALLVTAVLCLSAVGGPQVAAAPSGEARASAAIAVSRLIVRVHAGRAQLFLACHNARCRGVVRLVAQLGSSRGGKSPPEVTIARARFSIAPETTVQRRIPLNRAGRRLMRRAKRSGRYVLLQGHGVRNRTVILKRVSRFPPA